MVSLTVMLFGCNMDRKTKKGDGGYAINTTEQDKKVKPLFSVSALKGANWTAAYTVEGEEYNINFTDSFYICTSVILGRSRVYTYPYYLSTTRNYSFEWEKVGTGTKGDYLVFYDKSNVKNKVKNTELIWISPTKLVLVRQQYDTVHFMRR